MPLDMSRPFDTSHGGKAKYFQDGIYYGADGETVIREYKAPVAEKQKVEKKQPVQKRTPRKKTPEQVVEQKENKNAAEAEKLAEE